MRVAKSIAPLVLLAFVGCSVVPNRDSEDVMRGMRNASASPLWKVSPIPELAFDMNGEKLPSESPARYPVDADAKPFEVRIKSAFDQLRANGYRCVASRTKPLTTSKSGKSILLGAEATSGSVLVLAACVYNCTDVAVGFGSYNVSVGARNNREIKLQKPIHGFPVALFPGDDSWRSFMIPYKELQAVTFSTPRRAAEELQFEFHAFVKGGSSILSSTFCSRE